MLLELKSVSCGYGEKAIFQDISFSVARGETLCLLGPNGVGKTTLFKTILGLLPPMAGEILLSGENISAWTVEERARRIAYVPQMHTPPFPFTVHDVVVMGRAAHISSFGIPGKKDRRIADDAIEMLGIGHLAQKIYTKISGGERQIVLLARAIAQQPQLLCMDEPTASLDFGNQVLVMNRIRALGAAGITVMMTTHAPSHAFYCADHTAVMGRDGVFFVGRTNNVITEERLERLYGVTAKIVGYENIPETRTCVPLPPMGSTEHCAGRGNR
ncbi:ABC transporter ATP-binding protein [Selenomonas sp. oral taxon 136]|uniref:ABC transporter ATP-binding protein n=1 Tax=Selenomonas sp. oral taxon 136 TaxID=713030 RepID=UPI00076817BC|nr:ABC transporter ATP-binding protein [Selenomonas sp. oral taxon 136]AME04255.1 ABC transporter ATP-binding protein [Selenomonas sp. oral taxon 136]